VNAVAVDRRLAGIHERFGSRALDVLYRATTGFSVVAALAVALITVRYVEATPLSAWGTVIGLPLLVLCVAGLVGRRVWDGVTGPIRLWLEGARDDETTRSAWERALRYSDFIWSQSLVIGIVAVIGPYALFAWWVFELPGREAAALAALCLAVSVWVTILYVLVADLFLRPVRTALAMDVLQDGRPDPSQGVSIRTRIIVSMPVISLLTGAVVALTRTLGAGAMDELARLLWLTCGLSLTMGLLLTIVFARSLLRPLDDLVSVAERVDRGDHTARVDITTDDEFGLLAITFNEMLDEREKADQQLRALRSRIIRAADDERRRIERNIHDGAQQRIVALALRLRLLEQVSPSDGWKHELARIIEELRATRLELQQLAQGLLPTAITSGGLKPALEALAASSTVTVQLDTTNERFPELLESTIWFLVSESLTNMAKHAAATTAKVTVTRDRDELAVCIADDGVGGAAPANGSGLAGLADRIRALGGTLEIHSPQGGGTRLDATLPVVVSEPGPRTRSRTAAA